MLLRPEIADLGELLVGRIEFDMRAMFVYFGSLVLVAKNHTAFEFGDLWELKESRETSRHLRLCFEQGVSVFESHHGLFHFSGNGLRPPRSYKRAIGDARIWFSIVRRPRECRPTQSRSIASRSLRPTPQPKASLPRPRSHVAKRLEVAKVFGHGTLYEA